MPYNSDLFPSARAGPQAMNERRADAGKMPVKEHKPAFVDFAIATRIAHEDPHLMRPSMYSHQTMRSASSRMTYNHIE